MKSPCAFMAFWFRPYKNIKQIYYDMRKQITLLCMMAFLSSLHVTAQSFRKDIDVKPELSASNGVAYPTPSGKLTPPPTGYVPVYISHYGRMVHVIFYQDKTILDRWRYLSELIRLVSLVRRVGKQWVRYVVCMLSHTSVGVS